MRAYGAAITVTRSFESNSALGGTTGSFTGTDPP